MNGMTLGQKMRWIAGGMYLFLAVYQVACVRGSIVHGTMADTGIVALLAIVFAAVALGMAVWMFSSKKELTTGAHRAIIVGTIVAVCYELLTYSGQTPIIQLSWQSLFGGEQLPPWGLYGLVIVRLLVVILAAFFALSSRPGYDAAAEEEVLEVDVVDVVVEDTKGKTEAGD